MVWPRSSSQRYEQEAIDRLGHPTMARKQNKPKTLILHYQRLSIDALYECIDRARERNDARAGIDIAKECYRRDPSPAHTQLLCEQYHRRARQLMEKNLATEAMTVLGHALLLGPGNADLLRLAFDCGLRSGRYEAALQVFDRLKDEAEKARARVLLADEAVAKGEAAVLGHADPPLREDAGRIRRAFAAYERGDDSAVSAELQPIGLRSPCAAWKWLLVGLSARAREDPDAARKCWSRVNGDGTAARLAQTLMASLVDPSSDVATGGGRSPLELDGWHPNPRVARLHQIKAALGRGHAKEALRLCSSLIGTIDRAERQAYALRLGRAVCGLIDVEPGSGNTLQRIFGPQPEDHWYTRAAALRLEDTDVDEALYGWNLYLRELGSSPAIAAPLRDRARSLIWRRMGELNERIEADGPFYGDDDTSCGAVACYRKSIAYFPDCLETQEKLLDSLRRDGETRAAEVQAEHILKRWPTHVSSLLFSAERCVERSAFRKALDYLQRAREAEPFHGNISRQMIMCLLLSARKRLDKSKIDLARKDYEEAETFHQATDDAVPLYCKWAALEWRAGDAPRAEELVTRAHAAAVHPLQSCYQLAIELSRAEVPAEVRRRFESELAVQWRGRPTAANAAAVAGLTMAIDATGTDYEGRGTHRRAVSDYLKRAHGLDEFTEAQLMSVGQFLLADEDYRLAARYAATGAKRFTENLQFPLLMAKAEYGQGLRRLTRKSRKLLARAKEQAAKAGDVKTLAELEAVQYFGTIDSRAGLLGLLEAFAEFEACEEEGDFALPRPRGRRSNGRSRGARSPAEPMLFEDI